MMGHLVGGPGESQVWRGPSKSMYLDYSDPENPEGAALWLVSNAEAVSPSVILASDVGGGAVAQLEISCGGGPGMWDYGILMHGTLSLYANDEVVVRMDADSSGTGAAVRFQKDAGTLVALLQENGYMGIGVASPSASLDVVGAVEHGSGSVGTPSISFGGDTNTGFFRQAADAIGAATGGVLRWITDAAGNFLLGLTAAGTSAARVLGLANATAPTSSPADGVQLYAGDQVAGNSCLKIRTENSAVLSLYQETAVADPAGGATIDAECRAQLAALLARLRLHGLIAS